ncbi:unnamed protein product [Diatraea saccharalis]|uniref:phospholipase A2 n=1 Tax=Diatraea saccharalis TaxID=40085 RepID=A0A9N9R4X2_9NEOP|nr:unnamed protein product [Diatraea saccharalis]
MQDCEFITQRKTARNFLKTLRKELKLALDEEGYRLSQKNTASREDEKFFRHFRNLTVHLLKESDKLPTDIAQWFDYEKLKMECLRRHEELTYMMENRNKVGENSLARSRRSIRANFIVPGTKWCGAGQLAESYNELGTDKKEDRCCRAHDNCRKNIGPFKRRYGLFNFRPYTISYCRCDRRPKRDAMELLRVPGTKWCGKGFSATKYSQLGGYTRTDRCCRTHDLRCPFWIGGMEKKYGLYNWRVNTLMHCRCDESQEKSTCLVYGFRVITRDFRNLNDGAPHCRLPVAKLPNCRGEKRWGVNLLSLTYESVKITRTIDLPHVFV